MHFLSFKNFTFLVQWSEGHPTGYKVFLRAPSKLEGATQTKNPSHATKQNLIMRGNRLEDPLNSRRSKWRLIYFSGGWSISSTLQNRETQSVHCHPDGERQCWRHYIYLHQNIASFLSNIHSPKHRRSDDLRALAQSWPRRCRR